MNMTTVGKLFDELVTELEELYSQQEAINIVRLVFQEKLGLSRVDMALNKADEIDEKSRKLIFKIAEKLIEGQPVQQVIGNVHFLNCKLRVNKNVLIPRPETEELVHWVLKENTEEEISYLDIGTGSGCIAISIAKNKPESMVYAIDISQPALELAQINAISNTVEVDYINLDILNEDNWKKLKEYNVIISNPPYVPENEKGRMHTNVLNHEPHMAIFVKDSDPLIFYKKITELATKHLQKGGKLYFEIHENYGNQVKKILAENDFTDISLRKDINGKFRFVRGVKE